MIGSAGQVGSDLCGLLAADPRLPATAGLTRVECDITDPARVRAVIRDQARPAKIQGGLTVVNTAAWTDVDGAESDEMGAYAVNAAGPAHLAAACAEAGATLIHLSTDYAFDGTADKPYEVDDPTGPVSAYGRTKLAGEQAVLALCPSAFVVRTAWVYGATGKNFVKTMARLAAERDVLTVVDDQRGSPTWSADLAGGLIELALSDASPGIYHYTNGGDTTWFGFARAIMEELGEDPAKVHPTTTAAFPRPAPRPAYSVLSTRRWIDAGLTPPRPWRDALAAAFAAHRAELGRSAQGR
ncbi:dTDP-4-dehydrorhamnose reductase [Frankia sp. CNm7]|uniref:dTDP-4-dehydrorhamnose reductase n=1 Tax=Frankia nepalensis TaxID=1836974 RepID=A0A937RDD2_9ACTN|nr:dTDP-4-dehydrorhamnose reductase [Frankia nepalensis]MBL7496826.1 dTDP-4-dehydrorhamnose reductase [Frankia nepalensis]MBL7510963.1 dTDP-4-dehydrorhamnose reductase [Frankia nepalensis]MBL7522555.1 dTDP-4-dehydrorhamnose reductase [Frankia nepalensis]MBL7626920.1 dTDP-4-dehydrorhamnose reductase [Frankia nepalensis]